jgi:hypothetical protein
MTATVFEVGQRRSFSICRHCGDAIECVADNPWQHTTVNATLDHEAAPPVSSGHTLTVTEIDREAGVITFRAVKP